MENNIEQLEQHHPEGKAVYVSNMPSRLSIKKATTAEL